MNEKLSITMSGENCITKYMLSFVKKKEKEKIYGMYKKGPDTSHQTQWYSGEQDGKRGRTGRFFLFTLYTILDGLIFLMRMQLFTMENFSLSYILEFYRHNLAKTLKH